MTLEYSSSRATIARWYWRSLRRNPRHRAFWIAWVALAFLGGVILSPDSADSRAELLGYGVIAVLVVVTFFALYPLIIFKSQVRSLTLVANGITTTIRGKTENYRWSDVSQLERVEGFLIITFKNANAFIVPPTAFSGAPEQDLLYEECLSWRNAARVGPAV